MIKKKLVSLKFPRTKIVQYFVDGDTVKALAESALTVDAEKLKERIRNDFKYSKRLTKVYSKTRLKRADVLSTITFYLPANNETVKVKLNKISQMRLKEGKLITRLYQLKKIPETIRYSITKSDSPIEVFYEGKKKFEITSKDKEMIEEYSVKKDYGKALEETVLTKLREAVK